MDHRAYQDGNQPFLNEKKEDTADFKSLKTGHAPLYLQKSPNSLSEQPYQVCFQIFADKLSVN